MVTLKNFKKKRADHICLIEGFGYILNIVLGVPSKAWAQISQALTPSNPFGHVVRACSSHHHLISVSETSKLFQSKQCLEKGIQKQRDKIFQGRLN